jgi:catechol 2,3-dioxygenase-like lactoylglutathione lyase family enzyme
MSRISTVGEGIHMKDLRSILLLVMAVSIASSTTACASEANGNKQSLPKLENHMSNAVFGNHSALRVSHSQQDRIRLFYHDILGCEITKKTENVDMFRMGNDFFITFLYGDETLPESDWSKSIWLEIKSDDAPTMKRKILDFGVTEVKSMDKAHLYFQAPGGQVFRLVGTNDDLSKFEK